MNTNIEKSFFCLGQAQKQCFSCSYCRAIDSCSHEVIYDALPTQINPRFKNLPVAINLFYGDPLLQLNSTVEYLHKLEKAGHKGIVTIITKGDFSKFPDIPFDLDLHIAFSTFGKDHEYDGGSWKRFINNLEQIKHRKYNYTYSIEFRPICFGINDDYATLEKVIKVASEYNLCVGYCGLQGKPETVEFWRNNSIDLKPYPGYSFGHKKPLSKTVEQNLRHLAEQYQVILFRKTSCLLSYTHNKSRDYNCHYYRPDEVSCASCPMNSKCQAAKHAVEPIVLPFDFDVKYVYNHTCTLYKNGKCNYPTSECCNIEGRVITTNHPLTIADYRLIKWLTGCLVDSDFSYNQNLSDFWTDCKYYEDFHEDRNYRAWRRFT